MITASAIYIQSLPTYWALKMTLLAVLIFCGYGISYRNKDNNYFWYYGAVVILFYALIEGLRFERGTDYHQYYSELIGQLNGDMNRELLYQLVVDIVHWLKIPFWAVFVCYSGLIISSVLSVVRHFPRYAIVALPVFFLLTDYPAENLIRQFVAIPFILFALSAYLDGKIVKTFILLAVVPFIHLSGLFGVGIFVALMFFNPTKYVRTPWILVAAYFLLCVVWDASYLEGVSDSLADTSIDGGESKYQGYIDNSDRWFTDEGSLSDGTTEASTFGKLMTYAFNSFLIFFGFYATKEDDRFRIPYWFTFLAIMVFAIAQQIELYRRFGWWIYTLLPIIVGYVTIGAKMRLIYRLAFFTILSYVYLYQLIVSFGTMPADGCAFVWDII
jgi:hypothetical protein